MGPKNPLPLKGSPFRAQPSYEAQGVVTSIQELRLQPLLLMPRPYQAPVAYGTIGVDCTVDIKRTGLPKHAPDASSGRAKLLKAHSFLLFSSSSNAI